MVLITFTTVEVTMNKHLDLLLIQKHKAVAGIDIENDPNIDFFKPPQKPYPTGKLYWFGRMWQMADFNKEWI